MVSLCRTRLGLGLCTTLFLALGADATGRTNANQTTEHLLQMIQSSRPEGADHEFDCAWRKLAMEYAPRLQPWLSTGKLHELHDALELSTLCNLSFSPHLHGDIALTDVAPAPAACEEAVYVSPDGSDQNLGGDRAPVQTIERAVAVARQRGCKQVLLQDGVHYLHETITLTAEDSGMVIGPVNQGAATVSGGRLLKGLQWTPAGEFNGNVFVADVSSYELPHGVPALQLLDDTRATLARFPNANPELDLFPVGYITDKTSWLPPTYHGEVCDPKAQCGPSKNVTIPVDDAWHGMYQNYTVGVGGACERYMDFRAPWCSGDFYLLRQFPEMHTRSPSGMVYKEHVQKEYSSPEGARVHAWRPGHWYTWMFEVESVKQDTGEFVFSTSRGGNQGGEGNDAAGEWFIENVKEELDAPNEFFYDSKKKLLYYSPNSTHLEPPPEQVVVPTLSTFFDLVGNKSHPVTNVSFVGLTFKANRPTFMEPRSNPSGGDWSLEREGALRLEGTEHVTIERSLFTKLDSNGISLNGYNRYTLIDRNEFVWLGQNAVASWGREDEAQLNSGLDGNQPRHTTLSNNFVHEIGHIQKQSSFYFQAISCQSVIHNNIVFNIPRAAINFNDGFGGGAELHHNLLFNTCRESGDHGAFNSWDRLPYITEVRDGSPSTVPAVNNVHNNFIVANYAADGGCLDNDDGSSYYDIHHNFCAYGGHKQNFDGHSKRGFHNLYVYPQVYGAKCVDEETQGEATHTSGPYGLPPAGYAEEYTDNICILSPGAPYISSGGNLSDVKDFNNGLKLRNNTIFADGGSVNVKVSGQTVSFKEFQSRGFDSSSQVRGDMPSTNQIIGWVKQLLGF